MTAAKAEGGGGVRGWRWMVGLCLAGALLAWGVHAALVVGNRRPAETCVPGPNPFLARHGLREVVAALHVHTTFSWDGVGTVRQVVESARETGVEAVLLAEHNTTGAWGAAGLTDGVLVIPGVEASTPQGHYLVWGVPAAEIDALYALHQALYNRKPTAWSLDSLAALHRGVGAVAHPRGTRKPWKGRVPPGAGIEVVNGDAEWRDDPLRDILRALIFYPLEPEVSLASLVDRPDPSLALWDTLLLERPTVGISGLDAHGGIHLKHLSDLPFPSYGALMGLVRQHIFLPHTFSPGEGSAPDELLRALAAGRHYVGFDCFGSTRGFAFWGVSGEAEALMGEELPLSPGAMLAARVPQGVPAVLRVHWRGKVVAEIRGSELAFPVRQPGAYRLEVLQLRRAPFGGELLLPWIISNPIYVGDSLDTDGERLIGYPP